MLRTRWLVLGFWLVVLIAGGLASTRLGVLLSNGFGVPRSDSAQAQAVLLGIVLAVAYVVVVRSLGIGAFLIPLISVGAARTPLAQLARGRLRIPLPPSSRTISSHKRQRG